MAKVRIDQLLVQRGLADSRARAQSLITLGQVFAAGEALAKPGKLVLEDADIEIRGEPSPWVSRAALKLLHGLDHFGLDPAELVALDVGASTGGFTQVLLAKGAYRVYAIDVGTGQLAASLRDDPRIVSLEKTNARYLSQQEIPEPVGAITCDASFIGLETLLPAPLALAAPGAFLLALVKPQFEVGPSGVGSGGIVRDENLQKEVCDRLLAWLGARPGWKVLGLCDSPILGGDGNREFLLAGRYQP